MGAHRKHFSQHVTLEPSPPEGDYRTEACKRHEEKKRMPEKQGGQARAEKGEKTALSELLILLHTSDGSGL